MDKQYSGPFHEVIVKLIETCSEKEAFLICDLLARTHLPKGHDNILKTLEHRFRDPKFKNYSFLKTVKEIILEKKQEAEAKAQSPYGGDKSRALFEILNRVALYCMQRKKEDIDTNIIAKFFEVAKKIHGAKNDEQFALVVAEIDKVV